ncbi:acyltransferase family protein [Runella aurantiaca]|uniref:Acyltransferase n=1 Tax=Runella aurantiaca TaxID=2282308 RepID=A0A369I8K7_9BACT|nr:acyltransferase [Runella aurantiaca]RDB04585.1 acyltransferase [Runella aurantiaca]
MSNKKQRLATLDTFRGIAALAVVLFHLTLHQAEAPVHFSWGVTGVDLFFIISGFVIYMTLNKTTRAVDFVFARFSRLYPVYWVAVTLTAVWMLIGKYWGYSDISWGDYLANMSMFQHYFGVRDLDESYWTLIVEMLFYGLMLLAFLFNKVKNLEWYGFALVVIQAIVHGWASVSYPSLYASIREGFPLINHFQLFWAGILYYKIYTEGYGLQRVGGIVLAYILTLFLFEKTGRSNLFLSWPEYIAVSTLYFGSFFLFVSQRLEWINNRITRFLGTISYSLYVIHHYFMNGVVTLLRDKLGWQFIPAALVALVGALVLAVGITYLVEKPALNYLRLRYRS